MHTKYKAGNLKGRDHLGGMSVGLLLGRLILKWTLEKQGVCGVDVTGSGWGVVTGFCDAVGTARFCKRLLIF